MNLLSGSNDTSSKRFSALITLANVLVLTYLAAWKSNWIAPEFMFNALCLIVGGGLGLTVIEKIFTKNQPPAQPQAQAAPQDEKPAIKASDKPTDDIPAETPKPDTPDEQ